jgi:hypothetical protein
MSEKTFQEGPIMGPLIGPIWAHYGGPCGAQTGFIWGPTWAFIWAPLGTQHGPPLGPLWLPPWFLPRSGLLQKGTKPNTCHNSTSMRAPRLILNMVQAMIHTNVFSLSAGPHGLKNDVLWPPTFLNDMNHTYYRFWAFWFVLDHRQTRINKNIKKRRPKPPNQASR